ncbi:MAG: thrombospondin type 3 repeat-containing protein [Saprospiraceae bacterium]
MRVLTAFWITLCLMPVMLQAQLTPQNRHAIAAKVLGIDYGTLNDADESLTFGLEVAYRYLITPNIGFAVPIKVGVADVVGDTRNRNISSIDALVHLYPFSQTAKLQPYVLGGIGYVLENLDDGNSQIPIGLGLNYMMGENSWITLQGEYRSSSADNRDNLHFGVGYLYQFGQTDSDGDGISDSEDACPNQAGSAATKGCPDADSDGIPDNSDLCPKIAGTSATQGCPDADGDKVADKDDMCPEVAGLAALKGCPDTDGDGVTDKDDMCPEKAGELASKGCPDTDGDGLHDGVDACPAEAGLASLNGCPGNDRDKDGILDDADQCPDVAGTAATMGCPDRDGDG